MSIVDNLKDRLTALSGFASDYFDIIYRTIFPFWTIKDIPSGANVLTGSFAIILLYFARAHLTQPLDFTTVSEIVGTLLFFVLLVSGLATAFDPALRVDPSAQPGTPSDRSIRDGNFKKLVSVICVGITIGYASIVIDALAEPIGLPNWSWIDFIFDKTSTKMASDHMVGAVGAIFASSVLLANTLAQFGVKEFFGSARNLIWAVVIIIIVGVGIVFSVGQAKSLFQ